MKRCPITVCLLVAALGLAACGASGGHSGGGARSRSSAVAALPQAHPQAVQPTAGAHAATDDSAGVIVGDTSAHAPSLAQVKRELVQLNLCGGVTNANNATPVVADRHPGFVADPGTQQTEGELPLITAQLNALGKALGVTIYGISGYRTPAHSVAVGGYADDPHTKGLAEDIGVNSLLRSGAAQISEPELARFGLYRPFDPSDDPNNTEVNHVQLIPKDGPLTLAEATDTFDPDPSCS